MKKNFKELLSNALHRQEEIVEAAKGEARNLTEDEQKEFDELQSKIDGYKKQLGTEDVSSEPDTSAIDAETARAAEITALCRDFDMDATPLIKGKKTVEEVKTMILENMKSASKPVQTRGTDDVRVLADEATKVRQAMTDGLCLRTGSTVENPAAGANEFRGMSLRDMGIECLSREGEDVNALLRMSKDDLYMRLARAFTNPTAMFPAILDSVINKKIVEEYQKVPTTFDIWTRKGTLTDFKATSDHSYLLGGVGDFELVPENGELKNSMPETRLLPQRKLDTYGKQFSMSRQAFINDDIGFLSETPAAYTAASKKTIDKAVYRILCNNATIFDGKALFHADHKNLMGSGAKPSQTTIQAIILQSQKQTDPFGDFIYEVPRFLVVPMGYEFDLAVIFKSAQVVGSSNNDVNPLYNYPLQIVQTPCINSFSGQNACPWFMVTDPTTSKSIQVDYLNGQETPTFRRSEPAGQLGFVWDIWLDWGITAVDFRGIYKNPGEVIS